MSEKYIQIKGSGRERNIVQIVNDEHEEDPSTIVLETENKFRYGVSQRDFQKHYMLLSEWEEKKKKKKSNAEVVVNPQSKAPTSESPPSDARTRGEVPHKE
jgi:hypothetical protein